MTARPSVPSTVSFSPSFSPHSPFQYVQFHMSSHLWLPVIPYHIGGYAVGLYWVRFSILSNLKCATVRGWKFTQTIFVHLEFWNGTPSIKHPLKCNRDFTYVQWRYLSLTLWMYKYGLRELSSPYAPRTFSRAIKLEFETRRCQISGVNRTNLCGLKPLD